MSRASTADNEESPQAYAARLAKYISDPSTIHARTLDFWGRAPSLAQCATMRAKVERERKEYRKACEKRAEPLGRYITPDEFPCGHERSLENTYYAGNREACRSCQKQAAENLRTEIELQKRRDAEAEEHRRILAEYKPDATPTLINPFSRVISRAQELTGISAEDITSRRRFRKLIAPRFAAIHAMRSINFSLPRIATMFGMMDHTSVRNALEKARIMCERDPKFAALCLALEAAAVTKPAPLPSHIVDQFTREAA